MASINLKNRINKYDNIKGLAIILVVFVHMIIIKNNGVKFLDLSIIKNFLLIIILPLFFFVSGYFSKIGPNYYSKAVK